MVKVFEMKIDLLLLFFKIISFDFGGGGALLNNV